jgi:hypothetical protein
MESTKKLNFFPNRHGVSKHYSPRMILHHENLDYDRHYKEENEDDDYDQYDKMDVNKLADITNKPHQFNVPNPNPNNQINEPPIFQNEEEKIVFEDKKEDVEEIIDKDDSEPEFKDSGEEDISLEADKEEETNPTLHRTERVRVPNPRYQHLQTLDDRTEEYSIQTAHVIAMTMSHYMNSMAVMNDKETFTFIQTYSLNKGLKKFGDRGKEGAHKERKQLHDRVVFEPILIVNMMSLERKRAMESLLFLTEKRDGMIKAQTCTNGSTQHKYIPREEASSPTASTEAILITGVLDAKQRRDVMTLDIPNAFMQTPVPKSGEKIIMKIRGRLVDILTEICPGVYNDYVIYKGKHKVLYVKMLMALYEMLISSILYYKKFRKDNESIGFEVNPYDI